MNELMAELTRYLPGLPIVVFEYGVLLLLCGILKQLMVVCRMLKKADQ